MRGAMLEHLAVLDTPMPELLFIVQIDQDLFFAGYDTRPLLTPWPSVAIHVTYSEADSLCMIMRKKGHKNAVACTVEGVPVTRALLRDLRLSAA